MPGPLPNPEKRRRNAPTIDTSELPVDGRKGRAPACPLELGGAGARWWAWAWRLPQATRWDDGSLYFVARRAVLEDHVAALSFGDSLDLGDLFDEGNREAQKRVEWALNQLRRNAAGETTLMKEMRELDNRLGLNPKAMAELRWSVAKASEKKRALASVAPLPIKDPTRADAAG
jgi:hypothetical protein